MNTLIILHGHKLNRDGTLSPLMLERIDVLNDLIKIHSDASVFICGGQTRKRFSSESRVIFNYIKNNGGFLDNRNVLFEENSKTTTQSIRNIQKIVSNDIPSEIFVITSIESALRFKFLYRKLWPKIMSRLIFVTRKRQVDLPLMLKEKIYLMYAHFDPENEMTQFLVKFFRNA